MKTTALFASIAAALILGLAASTAHAGAISAAADFNDASAAASPPFTSNVPAGVYANGGLIGQPATAPAASQWVNTSAAGTNPITISGNNGTNTGNGLVTLTTSGEDDRLPFTGALNAADSSSVYLSADINLTAAQTGDYFLSLGDGSTSIFDLRIYAKAVTGGYALALLTNGSTAPAAGAYGAAIPFNTKEHIVAEYDFVAGSTPANDTSELYLNPSDPLYGGNNLYVNGVLGGTTTDATQLSAVYLRQGSAASAPSGTVDNIAVVPEPATFALGGLGLIALIGLARRTFA
jgi:hypothetical protein